MAHLSSANASEKGDVELLFSGDRMPVIVGPALRASKWRGGVWVRYIASTEGDFVVEISDGSDVAGFLLFPSENYIHALLGGAGVGSNANFTAGQPATGVGGQNVMTMVAGSTRAFFKVYETVALAGGTRSGGAITYGLHDPLKISENGLLCNDGDVELGLAGIADPVVVGMVAAVPAARNGSRLCMDMKY